MDNVMEQAKQSLREAIRRAVAQTGIVDEEAIPEITLEVPKEKEHGDFSTNIAMQLTRVAKRNPRQIAEAIVQHIDGSGAHVAKVDVAGPGFLNFYLDKSYLHGVIPQILREGENYGRATEGLGQRIQVEFVSANPTGSLHLGHARGAAVGDALCHLLDFAGYHVEREYYINDAGKQIENLAASIEARYRQQLGEQADMPEDGYYGEDIIGFARELAESRGDGLLTLPEQERKEFLRAYGLERELDKIKRDLSRFRVHFDRWFSETSLYEQHKPESVLDRLGEKGETYEEDGALWLRTTTYGDDKDRVLVKNDGSYTYLTPDIAYHQDKLSRGFDKLINIWGADHHGYVPRMKAALSALGYEADRLTVLIAQMVSLYQDGEKVKMSKRTGKAVTMVDLMDEVGVDAIRYFFTMRSIDSHLDFDMDLAVSRSNENPVYYVQYAHARICSIFRQADEQGVSRDDWLHADLSPLRQEAEYDLLVKLAAFGEEVRTAAAQFAPHRLVRYVYELAALFHSYYKAERVMTEQQELTRARLALLGALRIVIGNVLRMIGVSTPEKM